MDVSYLVESYGGSLDLIVEWFKALVEAGSTNEVPLDPALVGEIVMLRFICFLPSNYVTFLF